MLQNCPSLHTNPQLLSLRGSPSGCEAGCSGLNYQPQGVNVLYLTPPDGPLSAPQLPQSPPPEILRKKLNYYHPLSPEDHPLATAHGRSLPPTPKKPATDGANLGIQPHQPTRACRTWSLSAQPREPPRRMPTHQPPRLLTDSCGARVLKMRKPVRAEQVAPPALACGC